VVAAVVEAGAAPVVVVGAGSAAGGATEVVCGTGVDDGPEDFAVVGVAAFAEVVEVVPDAPPVVVDPQPPSTRAATTQPANHHDLRTEAPLTVPKAMPPP